MRNRSNSVGYVLGQFKEAKRRLSLVQNSRADVELGLIDEDLVKLQQIREKYREKAAKFDKFRKRRSTIISPITTQTSKNKQLERMGEIAIWLFILFIILVCILAEIELNGAK